MATYLTNTDELTQIASAIRRILNTNSTLNFPYADTINAIVAGNWKYDANISTPSQIVDTTCVSIKNNGFSQFNFLTSVSFPACTTIGSSAFNYCSSLTSVSFPACTTISDAAFYACASLRSVSFPACTTIGNYAFCKCENLSEIYLAKNSVVTLMSEKYFGTFDRTGITSTTGSIRVPSNLVNSYKTATNWTYFSNRIFAI